MGVLVKEKTEMINSVIQNDSEYIETCFIEVDKLREWLDVQSQNGVCIDSRLYALSMFGMINEINRSVT